MRAIISKQSTQSIRSTFLVTQHFFGFLSSYQQPSNVRHLPLRFFSSQQQPVSKGFHSQGQDKVTLEEDVIDLRAERERRMAANPFAGQITPKKHKDAS